MKLAATLGRLALAVSLILPVLPAHADGAVFRHKLAVTEVASPPGTDEPNVPETPGNPGDEEPAAPAFYRVVVESFHGPGSVAEVAMVRGVTPIPPAQATISGAESAEAFDGNPATGWTGSDGAADIVYGVEKGRVPDALELTALDIDGPASFYIEKSDDGLFWTPVVSYVGEPEWAPGEKRRYPFTIGHVGEPGSEHRYWRVAVEKFNWDHSYNGIDEIVFRNSSGADVTVGGQGYSDDTRGVGALDVFDKTDRGWMGQHRYTYPAAFWYEFPQPQAIGSVDIVADVVDNAPQRFRIESSDDARVWTVRAFYFGQGGWEQSETRNYPVPNPPRPEGHHQYWRIDIHSMHPSASARLNELRFLGEGGQDIHRASIPISSSQESGSVGPEWIFDDRDFNPWIAAPSDSAPWVGYVFPKPVKAESVSIWSHNTVGPRDFTVSWSDDGVNWTSGPTYRGNGTWAKYERRDFQFDQSEAPEGHYRYWRVFVDKTAGHIQEYVAVREMYIRDGAGASIVGKGVPIAGTQPSPGSLGVERAFDGIWNSSSNYYWRSAAVPDWIGYEFPVPVRPEEIALRAAGNYAPRDFRIQHSADGVTWTTTSTHRGQGMWAAANERSFDVFDPGPSGPGHQFWRILVHDNNGDANLSVLEMDFFASDLVDRQTHGAPFASGVTYASLYGPEKAFDGMSTGYTNHWEANRTAEPGHIGYAFPFRVDVSEVHIQAYSRNTAVRDFDIQWSDDEVNWTTAAEYRGAGSWSANEWRIFPIPRPDPEPEEAYVYELEFSRSMVTETDPSMEIRSLVLLEEVTRNEVNPVFRTPTPAEFVPLVMKGVALAEDRTKLPADVLGTGVWRPGTGVDVAVIRLEFAHPVKIESYQVNFRKQCACTASTRLYKVHGEDRSLVEWSMWPLIVESD